MDCVRNSKAHFGTANGTRARMLGLLRARAYWHSRDLESVPDAQYGERHTKTCTAKQVKLTV